MHNELFPRVGVAVIAQSKDNKIILGKRSSSHGIGQWAPPGGHLEFRETPIECAMRELKEETGLMLLNSKEVTFTNDFFDDYHKHYITIFISGYVQGEPQLLEPHKCESWQWFSWNGFPQPLFLPFKTFLQKIKNNESLSLISELTLKE